MHASSNVQRPTSSTIRQDGFTSVDTTRARGGPPPRGRPHPVPEVARLDVVGLEAPEAALPAVGHRQVRLPDAPGPDEGDVAPCVEVGERRELGQRVGAAPPYPAEVEPLEGLGLPPRQAGEPQQRLHRLAPALVREVGQRDAQGRELGVPHVVVGGERRQLLGVELETELAGGVADRGVGVVVGRHGYIASPRKSNLANAG